MLTSITSTLYELETLGYSSSKYSKTTVFVNLE